MRGVTLEKFANQLPLVGVGLGVDGMAVSVAPFLDASRVEVAVRGKCGAAFGAATMAARTAAVLGDLGLERVIHGMVIQWCSLRCCWRWPWPGRGESDNPP